MYNQDKFINILKKCQGTSSLNEYARISDIDVGYLWRIINRKKSNPPSPKILEKIANTSKGITTYNELMEICGYIIVDKEFHKVTNSLRNPSNFSVVPILIAENGQLYETKEDIMLPFERDLEKQYFGYRHYTDEMAPLLSTKDTAIMEKCDTYVPGKTYLIKLDNQIYIRKIIQRDNQLELEALNPYFPAIKLTNEDLEKQNFEILGKMLRSEITFE